MLIFLLTVLSAILIQAQIKPTKTPVKAQKTISKPVPPKVQEITTQKATTEGGKSVILKSNGTWEFAPAEIPEQPKVKPCDLTLKDAPVIRGLRLGITRDDVQKAFGVGSNDERSPFYYKGADIKSNGILHYEFYDSTLKALTGFSGITVLELDFFDGEVHRITVKYTESTANFTAEQFRLKIIENFNLPAEGWVDSSFYYGNGVSFPTGKKLNCSEFEIELIYGSTLRLTNILTTKKIEESEKNKRDRFKP